MLWFDVVPNKTFRYYISLRMLVQVLISLVILLLQYISSWICRVNIVQISIQCEWKQCLYIIFPIQYLFGTYSYYRIKSNISIGVSLLHRFALSFAPFNLCHYYTRIRSIVPAPHRKVAFLTYVILIHLPFHLLLIGCFMLNRYGGWPSVHS